MNRIVRAARKLGLGGAALRFYHRPVGLVRQSLLEGGPFEQRRISVGHAAMRAAVANLPPLAEPPQGPQAEIAFLTGPKYWHQTAFCFVSLQRVCPFRITPVIYDDGSLDELTCDQLRRIIPWIRTVPAEATEARLDRVLPEHAFRSLRSRRRVYPHLRKLIDVHVESDRIRLVADSDMLFFRTPNELLPWFAAPHALYMQDVTVSYGYPRPFLDALVGVPVPEPVNVGLYALDGARLDWERIEMWCRRQNEEYGPHYLQEQALTAMALANQAPVALPRKEYCVMPDLAEGRAPTAILHHYVAHSKRSYLQHGWRLIEAAAQIGTDITQYGETQS